jgi:hypothetical protein
MPRTKRTATVHAKWDVDSRLKHGERLAEILSMTLRNLWEKLNVELVPETRSQRTGRMIRGWGGALVAGHRTHLRHTK